MAFVQITKSRSISKDQYDRIIQAAYGGKLAEGELFHVAGNGVDGWYVIDGWKTRQECDSSMDQLMPALQKEGIPMDSMTVEEFEIHRQDMG